MCSERTLNFGARLKGRFIERGQGYLILYIRHFYFAGIAYVIFEKCDFFNGDSGRRAS